MKHLQIDHEAMVVEVKKHDLPKKFRARVVCILAMQMLLDGSTTMHPMIGGFKLESHAVDGSEIPNNHKGWC